MIMESLSGIGGGSAAQATKDGQQLKDDLNRFLTLLVTQLQNQDPLDPLDANEFTAQLVQFASVEQQIYQNAHLEELLAVQKNMQVAAMVDYLGTVAEAKTDALPLQDGQALATYTLPSGARSATIIVKGADGKPVFTAAGAAEAGTHVFEWNGTDGNGKPLPDGGYRLEVVAKGADDAKVEAAITAFGRVTGAAADGGEVTLFLGDVPVKMSEVLSVKEPSSPTTGN